MFALVGLGLNKLFRFGFCYGLLSCLGVCVTVMIWFGGGCVFSVVVVFAVAGC